MKAGRSDDDHDPDPGAEEGEARIHELSAYRPEASHGFADRVRDSVQRRETAAEIGEFSWRVLAHAVLHTVGFLFSFFSPDGRADESEGGRE